MKKKIVIISIISVLLVVIGVTSYCVSRNKISNIKVSEDSILENDLSNVEIDKDEESTENLERPSAEVRKRGYTGRDSSRDEG